MTLNSTITDKPVDLGFQIELEFGNVGFWEEGKTGVPGESPQSRDENQQQTQPTYDAESGNRTWPAWKANAQPLRHACSPSHSNIKLFPSTRKHVTLNLPHDERLNGRQNHNLYFPRVGCEGGCEYWTETLSMLICWMRKKKKVWIFNLKYSY